MLNGHIQNLSTKFDNRSEFIENLLGTVLDKENTLGLGVF